MVEMTRAKPRSHNIMENEETPKQDSCFASHPLNCSAAREFEEMLSDAIKKRRRELRKQIRQFEKAIADDKELLRLFRKGNFQE